MMKNLTMPQAVLIVGLCAVLAWCASLWPDRHYYRAASEESSRNATIRVNKWTGKTQYRPIGGTEWKP